MKLNSPIHQLKGIGEKTEYLFQSIGVYTLRDILQYFPRGYEFYPPVCNGSDPFQAEEKAALHVRVMNPPLLNSHTRKKTATLEARLAGGHRISVKWFNSPFIRSAIKPGNDYILYGKIKKQDSGIYMEQPEVFTPEKYAAVADSLQPLYPLSKGITNQLIRRTVKAGLLALPAESEFLPAEIRDRNHLCAYGAALENIHFPKDRESCIVARDRLVFDELFLFALQIQLMKHENRRPESSFVFALSDRVGQVMENLPYKLTGAQQRAFHDVVADMSAGYAMNRLVQGDVGSGKTIVAFLAMINASEHNCQSALMVPTDVLARQHFQKLCQLCEENGIHCPVVLLTGSLGAAERRKAEKIMAEEPSAMVVGTHALVQDKARFNHLALVVTDEQHRFGVRQRWTLSDKGAHPHALIMSATPIPRTLAIILYGDMDISVIDEVPKKRLPIKNCVVGPSYREKAYAFIQNEVDRGHQAYIICPLVEYSESLEAENVIDYKAAVEEAMPSHYKIGCLHGKMKPAEKNKVMEAFLNNDIHILVSTTVVEVGVDVPNATVMLIENAERFGLAQLHQIRGRVGRSDAQSYCILMQSEATKKKNERLEILNHSTDGFHIAGEDLKLRGPGDFFGIRQSGEFRFRIADIFQDSKLLQAASYEASLLLGDDPKVSADCHAALACYLNEQLAESGNDITL